MQSPWRHVLATLMGATRHFVIVSFNNFYSCVFPNCRVVGMPCGDLVLVLLDADLQRSSASLSFCVCSVVDDFLCECGRSWISTGVSDMFPCDSLVEAATLGNQCSWCFSYFAGGMPPTPQAAQLTGQRQSQQQYDPSTGPPVQNAASLHTPLPQLPGRLPPAGVPTAALSSALQFAQQPQAVEAQTQLQIPVKTQQPNVPIPAPPSSQLPIPPSQPAPLALHVPTPGKVQVQPSQLSSLPQV